MPLDIEDCERELNAVNRRFYDTQIKRKVIIDIDYLNKTDNIWMMKFYRQPDFSLAKIRAGKDYPDPIESFIHEMLHIYFYLNGYSDFFYSQIYLYKHLNSIYKNEETNQINQEFIRVFSNITNLIHHSKMLPIFRDDLGNNPAKFVCEEGNDLEESVIANLTFTFDKKNPEKFFLFLEFFFTIRYNVKHSLDTNYNRFNVMLKDIDMGFWTLLDDCCRIWDQAPKDYNNTDFHNALLPRLDEYLSD